MQHPFEDPLVWISFVLFVVAVIAVNWRPIVKPVRMLPPKPTHPFSTRRAAAAAMAGYAVEKEHRARRERIATELLAGILSRDSSRSESTQQNVQAALSYADELITKLDIPPTFINN